MRNQDSVFVSNTPLVTILIVYWNNEEHLPVCLERLSLQTKGDFEIVLVNNGSAKESLAGFEAENLRLVHLDSNEGYAIANNIGARLARGKWLALLNADAFPEPTWLEGLLQAVEQNPDYTVFSSRQLQYHSPERLDGAGDSYHITGLAWRRYYNRPAEDFRKASEEIFSACPAAALYSREEFLKAGGFDEDYFSYFEDVDLGFRLRLNGARCLYVPDAVVHHVGSASTGKRSDFSVYYGYRNMIWTFFKNMPFPYFWLFLPLHCSAVIFFAIYLTLRGQGKIIWKAILDALHGLPKMLKKRKLIQKNLKIVPSELMRVMSTGILEPYIEFISRNRNK